MTCPEQLSAKVQKKEAGVAIIGLGRVGLPTAVSIAEKGFTVYGTDVDESVRNAISSGTPHISEVGLEARLKHVLESRSFTVSQSTEDACKSADIILIIVPTPINPDKTPDLSYVIQAGREACQGLAPGKLVVLESTVYPGVTEKFLLPELEKNGLKVGTDIGLAYCPERYNPGDTKHTPDNIHRIVGSISQDWGKAAVSFYSQTTTGKVSRVRDIKTAEAAKAIENAQRDLNIAFMNELAMIFERVGIDTNEVIEAASTKWNFNVYWPGPGVGGHCLPVDPYYLVHLARENGYEPQVITAGRAVNNSMPEHMFELLSDALEKEARSLSDARIVVMGASYKENVGDIREAPALQFVEIAKSHGVEVRIVDPFVDDASINKYGPAFSDVPSAAIGTDALVLFTAHDQFKELNIASLASVMRTNIFIDGRRAYDPAVLSSHGFVYRGIGAGRHNQL